MKTICLLASFLIITIVPLCGMEKNTSVIKKAIEFQNNLNGLPKDIQHQIKIEKQTYSLDNQKKNTTLIYPNFDCSLFCNNENSEKKLNIWITSKKDEYFLLIEPLHKKKQLIKNQIVKESFAFLRHTTSPKYQPFFLLTNKNYSALVRANRKTIANIENLRTNIIIFYKHTSQDYFPSRIFPTTYKKNSHNDGYFIRAIGTSINGDLNLLSMTKHPTKDKPSFNYLNIWGFCSNNKECKLNCHQDKHPKGRCNPRIISGYNNIKLTNTPITQILCLTGEVFVGIKDSRIYIISIKHKKHFLSPLFGLYHAANEFFNDFSPLKSGLLREDPGSYSIYDNYEIELKEQKLPKIFKIKQIAVDPNCRKQLIFVATTIIDNKEHANLYHIFLDQLLMKNNKYMFKKITKLQDGVPDFLGFEGDNAIVAYTKKENNTISVVTEQFCLIKRWIEIANNIMIQRNKNLFAKCLKEIVKH